MIQIDDNDLPITVAEKLIKARKPLPDGIGKTINKAMGGEGETDIFTTDDLLEISEYLRVFCKHNADVEMSE